MDTSSTLTPGQVSGLASAIDVPVYVIALLSPLDHPGTDYAVPSSIGAVVSTQLTNLCRWTGGDLMMASAPAHVSAAVRDLLAQLRHQYVLTFVASQPAGTIRVASPQWLGVRARRGYFAGAPGRVPARRGA